MNKSFQHYWGLMVDVITPQYCLCCLNKTYHHLAICEPCWQDLPWNTQHCTLCATPVAHDRITLCGKCSQQRPAYHRAIAPLLYSEPIKRLISQFKFNNAIHYGPLLAALFYDQYRTDQQQNQPQLLLPLPLHPQRIKQRGYNQAQRLCLHLSKLTNIPYDGKLLVKTKATRPQVGLTASQRQKNITDAYHVTCNKQYQHVALIDDVITTGSSVNEAAKTLKKNGIEHVTVWAIAAAKPSTML